MNMLLPLTNYNSEQAINQNQIGSLIRSTRTKKGLKQKDLTEILKKYGTDVTVATVSKWEKGDIIPNSYQLLAVCLALGIKDLVPYFTGQRVAQFPELNSAGEKKVLDYVDTLVKSGKYAPLPRKQIKYVDVLLYDLPVSAGKGQFLDGNSTETMRFASTTVPEGTDYCLRITGDSMEPDYHDGQYVFVQETTELHPGEIGIFLYDECGYIKLLDTQEPDEEVAEAYTDSDGVVHEQPVLISINKKYEPIVVSPYLEFHVKGRVLN